MSQEFFSVLNSVEDVLWNYLAVPAIVFLGVYLTVQSRCFQVRKFGETFRIFFCFFRFQDCKTGDGVHPLKAFFAAVGGCIGIGNIVAVCTAVQLGGPGALFWVWVTAFFGVMLKYAEVYLGMRFRIPDGNGGYKGGPMYYLQKAFSGSWIPKVTALLLCIYGVEIWQFSIVTHSVADNLHISSFFVMIALLALVLFAGLGGVARVGTISSAIIPIFVVIYLTMGCWILFQNAAAIPSAIVDVFRGAFSSHAAVGGFVGSTIMMTISQGVRRGCYTGDYGIGYASVIHSESQETVAEKQASLVTIGIFLDTFVICTMTILIILVTGVWSIPVRAENLIQIALDQYFPYMNLFMPLFLFLLGYSTVNAYFVFGIKSAEFLSPKHGAKVYYLYAIIAFIIFSYVDAVQAQTVMTIAGGFLLVINCIGIYRLRHEISYDL